MAITQHTWLYRNDLRNYPLSDRASVSRTTGVVDFHLALPDSLPLARVYVSRLVVEPRFCRLELSLDGYGQLVSADFRLPTAYRMYNFANEDGSIYGFVTFGSSAETEGLEIDQTLTADEGEVLESLVHRYPQPGVGGFLADLTALRGRVEFVGQAGVVCEVADVYYEQEGQAWPSLVIRLEDDIQTMVDPVPECSRRLDSGLIDFLVSEINGVRPNTEGEILLQIEAQTIFEYDDQGYPVFDGSGRPVEGPLPLLEVVPPGEASSATNFLGLKDNYQYQKDCPRRQQRVVYSQSKCLLCKPVDDQAALGHDQAGGWPITFAGAYLRGAQLTVLWNFFGEGSMQPGPNIGQMEVNLSDSGAAPVSVTETAVAAGTSPSLPGPLVPCTRNHSSPGSVGELGISTYKLSREIASGERFTLRIPPGSVVDQNSLQQAGNLLIDTCELVAQQPDGSITDEDLDYLEENCF